jgi:hypothetical protein|tara:strand:- start:318 stop:461 length:144 start_codon:yes stop_codon:yes gene_type:complete
MKDLLTGDTIDNPNRDKPDKVIKPIFSRKTNLVLAKKKRYLNNGILV